MKQILQKKAIKIFNCKECWCEFKTDEYIIKDKYEWMRSVWIFMRPPYTPIRISSCPICWEKVSGWIVL